MNVKLEIRSTAGEWGHPFRDAETVQDVIDQSVEHFRLSTGPGISYVLRDGNQTLPPGDTLKALGIRDGQVLVLQASQAQDG